MAKITKGSTFGCNIKQVAAMRALAMGKPEVEVIQDTAIFGPIPVDEDERGRKNRMDRNRRKLRAWMQDPKCQECYRAIMREIILPLFGKGVATLERQMDSDNEWIAQGAARDVLTRFGPQIMGDDAQKETVVRIEGMPTLGIPEPEDVEEMPDEMTECLPAPAEC